MNTSFYKYQGTGNDFILIDNRAKNVQLSTEKIAELCHRRFGIGADGLILLENVEGYDFKMVYFNADGCEGSMCGNGGRCIVKFASDLGIFSDSCHFIAIDGPHEAEVTDDDVRLKMSDVEAITYFDNDSFLNTGSPHLIKEVVDLPNYDVYNEGRVIRYNDYWQPKGGTNINFISKNEADFLAVRTYERGVEDETYSCGTGVTAAAIHAVVRNGMKIPVAIKTKGGNLSVSFETVDEGKFRNIYLSGPAIQVFSGTIQ